ncbi:uncharacterized protein AB675_1519 [Cyphellophora attinorum]|uniref:Uncharacterized protein n=1 Tax=Cyphellophora attinorum TaxID=1664694 RepID=A0A0N1NX83_9EURO|nr:uncharacterized protein AB675_1519 [Phialophora attinorum]KPI37244.1 hypothetical protein AB675_1519 [Phialophora attinorum]
MARCAIAQRSGNFNQRYSQELERMHASHFWEYHYLYDSPELSVNAKSASGYTTPVSWLQERDRQEADPWNRLPQMINCSLDPFIATPGVTTRQRSLVQFYMKDTATILFGVSNTPLYSPCAATGMAFVGDSKVAIGWMCILAEEMISALRGQNSSHSLAQQKARGYRNLKQAILNRRDNFQDAIMGVAIAGLFQYGFGDAYSQSLHTTMADRLIRERDSIADAIQSAPHLEPFYLAAQFAFGRTRIDSAHKLAWTRQQWISDIKAVFAASILGNTLESLEATCYAHTKQRLMDTVRHALAGHHKPSSFAKAMQLTLLNEISWTVLRFKNNLAVITKYFRRFHFICQHSILDADSSGGQTHELKAAAVASMGSRARRDVVEEVMPGKLLESDADVLEKHIVALQMFYYLGEESQDWLLSSLLQWLEMNDTACVKKISDKELELLEQTVMDNWSVYDRARTDQTSTKA